MRSLNEYLTADERSTITERSIDNTKPRSVKALQKIIKQRIIEQGPNCDLNDIDVSRMKSMSHLFCGDTEGADKVLNSFNGDISQWDVSNVKDMGWMFCKSQFNGDISKWMLVVWRIWRVCLPVLSSMVIFQSGMCRM